MDARDLLHGLPPRTLSELCQVSLSTARRWRRLGRVPPAYARVLELVHHGHLGAVLPAWSGWYVKDGGLWTPEDWQVRPGEVRNIPMHTALVRELQSLVRELRWELNKPRQWELALGEPVSAIDRR